MTDNRGTGDTLPTGATEENVVAPPASDVIGPTLDDTVLASTIAEQVAVDDPNNPPQPPKQGNTTIGSTNVNQDSH